MFIALLKAVDNVLLNVKQIHSALNATSVFHHVLNVLQIVRQEGNSRYSNSLYFLLVINKTD